MTTRATAMPPQKQLALVRWLGEETLSVVPATSVREGDKVNVGSFASFKWGGKFYESEILAISGLSCIFGVRLSMYT